MSTAGLILEDQFTDTLEKENAIEFPLAQVAVALFRDEQETPDYVALTPQTVKALTEAKVKVFMQHGFGAAGGYDDMDYANVGAEFEDDFYQLSMMAHTLVKHSPFSESQISMMQQGQLLVSFYNAESVTAEMLAAMRPKNISAMSFDLLKDDRNHSVLGQLAKNNPTAESLSISVANYVLPILEELVLTPRLRFVLQKYPQMMPAVYCMDGVLCHKEMAARLQQPYRDIITLCWELN